MMIQINLCLFSFPKCKCRQCSIDCPGECLIVYGGLEPVLSGVIGNYLNELFQSSGTPSSQSEKNVQQKASDVAYVSIHSVTIGSQPPLIRGVTLLGKEKGGDRYDYELDLLVLFEDMEIILGKWKNSRVVLFLLLLFSSLGFTRP